MDIFSNKITFMILLRNVTYTIFRISVKFDNIIFETKIKKLVSQVDSIDLAHRSDNIILMNPVNSLSICTARLTDGRYTVLKYNHINYYDFNMNCIETCFAVELNANISIKAIAVWYKKSKTNIVGEILCSIQINKLRISTIQNDSKQICEDIFMREENFDINMIYANCNQKVKLSKLHIEIYKGDGKIVEIAVYNKWSIEHLPLECINNKSITHSIIKSKKIQTLPWNLIVDPIRIDDTMPIDKSFKEYYNKVSETITNYNTFSCFLFNSKNRVVLFIFEFDELVLMKSITFITGLSLENNTLFLINQYSSMWNYHYEQKLENINKCNTKLVKEMSILYNGYIMYSIIYYMLFIISSQTSLSS